MLRNVSCLSKPLKRLQDKIPTNPIGLNISFFFHDKLLSKPKSILLFSKDTKRNVFKAKIPTNPVG